MEDEWVQKRVFLFSHPRTASNLLTRILSGQSEWRTSDYNFLDAFIYMLQKFDAYDTAADVPQAVQEGRDKLIEQGREKLDQFLNTAAQDKKHVLIKEHAHVVAPAAEIYWNSPPPAPSPTTSPTIFPPTLMSTWRPLFLIRNPIAIYESWLRIEGPPYPPRTSRRWTVYANLHSQRRVFDYYLSQAHHLQHREQQRRASLSDAEPPPSLPSPLVLDADDLLASPTLLHRLCEEIGTDAAQLVWTWDADGARADDAACPQEARTRKFFRSLRESTGVDPSKRFDGSGGVEVGLAEKEAEWEDVFGVEAAAELKVRVRESWPDYEYLRGFRMR